MASAMRLSSGSSDPFAKVKGLINEMITKLEDSAASDASHKAYCDKELSETQASKGEKQTEIAKLSTKIDQMSARSANLKEQVATLQGELAAAAKSQAEWDKFRREENVAYKTNKAEMEEGLNGIKMALKVLRDYYAKSDKPHGAADGAASGIVGLLEVVESDFSKGLAEMNAVEDNAQVTYDAASRENEITTTMKTKDVEYKVKEHVGLDKAVSEATSDRSSVQAELDAIVEYLGKLKDMCVAKAEPYEERARRREAEVNGLKEALKVLDGEAVLLQQSQRSLRGVTRHM
jgi:chromosome segregation ATPase